MIWRDSVTNGFSIAKQKNQAMFEALNQNSPGKLEESQDSIQQISSKISTQTSNFFLFAKGITCKSYIIHKHS